MLALLPTHQVNDANQPQAIGDCAVLSRLITPILSVVAFEMRKEHIYRHTNVPNALATHSMVWRSLAPGTPRLCVDGHKLKRWGCSQGQPRRESDYDLRGMSTTGERIG